MTYRRVYSCLEMIDIRRHNEFAKRASLHGIKIEFKKVKRQFEEVSQEQQKLMADVIKKASQRKIDEKLRRKK